MSAPHDCTACPLCVYRKQVVNGVVVGVNPQLMIVGEGPGYNEDQQGTPFVGATGNFLKQELHRYGIYAYSLTNATRCYPSETKKATEMDKAIVACGQYLENDIQILKPKVILALGAYAIRALGFTDPINTIMCHVLDRNGVKVIPSYHPAAFMRDVGSVHLFQLAVYKARLAIDGQVYGESWEPHYIEFDDQPKDGWFTIDTETSSKNPRLAELVIATVTSELGTTVIGPENTAGMEWLRGVLLNPEIYKNFQNGDYDIQVLEKTFGVDVIGYKWDSMLAEHLMHEESHYNLEMLRGARTNQPVYERELRLWKEEVIEVPNGVRQKKNKFKVLDGVYKNGNPKYKTETEIIDIPKFKKVKRGDNLDGYADVPKHILIPYGVYDSQTEHLVMKHQQARIKPNQQKLLQEIVLPAQMALLDMEREGIRVDMSKVGPMRQAYIERREDLREEIFKAADLEFKLTSPPEVKKILYEELGLPKPPVKSKTTGEVGTGKKALDWLITNANHPILQPLEDWRSINQIITNFFGETEDSTKGLMSNIQNERLHTTYRLTLETGRTATSPNLQNLPTAAKGKAGNLRELLIADQGNVLVQADYSQIELRVAAYESADAYLINLLETGGDVHTIFARELYGFEPELPDKLWKEKYDAYRTLAKRFTFGRLFGQSEVGMALTFNIPKEEAFRFQAVYAKLFPNMTEWWEKTIAQVRSGEPLETKFGRLRQFPAYKLFEKVYWRGRNGLFGHMDREALNFIPQGTAADCMLVALGNVRKRIKQFNLPYGMRLDVHDSLTLECKEGDKEKCADFMKAEMESVGEKFGWTLPVECKWGYSWVGEGGKL